MSEQITERLSVTGFCDYLAGRLDLAPGSLDPDADIRTDLGLDSIQMFIMLIAVEDLGVEVPEALMPHIHSLRDAYVQYDRFVGHRQ